MKSANVGLAIVFALFAGACGSLTKPYPAKAQYGLPVTAIPPASPGAVAPTIRTLRVEQVRVNGPFDGQSFVYRFSGDRFEVDYYNEFVVAPGQLLTAETVRVLGESGRFANVLGPSSQANADARLETTVTRLAGNYRNPTHPLGSVEVRFILLRDAAGMTTVLGEWTIEAEAPMADDAPSALPAALGKAYGEVLARWVEAMAAP